ncbi:hypothetical protein [Nonomuraea sp. B5E05]|uniref:hypothetical protein n=1 Tax=Nonomuraea sp. B5E05 TaxID=3153569 RepID=UPI003261915D
MELPVERDCPFNPPTAYERLREHAPISKVHLTSGGEAWWVSRQEEARAVLADPRGDPAAFKDPAELDIESGARRPVCHRPVAHSRPAASSLPGPPGPPGPPQGVPGCKSWQAASG